MDLIPQLASDLLYNVKILPGQSDISWVLEEIDILWVLKEITHFCLSLILYVTIAYCRLGHYYVTFNLCNINFGNRLKSKAVVIKTAF